MFASADGSTQRLIQLCLGYFTFYVLTGVTVKFFTGPQATMRMSDLEFLVYSTLGGNLICLAVVFARGWWRLQSENRTKSGWPVELLYIIPSGVCTAVVIPTTTLMYMLLPSVMVAMVIMRGAVIVISRAVDAIQIRQGVLKKTVYYQEDLAVVFAILAVCTQLFFGDGQSGSTNSVNVDPEAEVKFTLAMIVLASYVVAYFFRIYIMNYYKNTRGKGTKLHNEGFFAVEQISATVAIALGTVAVCLLPSMVGIQHPQLDTFTNAIIRPHEFSLWAILAGTLYGMVAFFSVFIFMFKGRTATFAGLVNRLTSLVAGTTATLVCWMLWNTRFPGASDWVSLGFILIAVAFLSLAERRRASGLEIGTRAYAFPGPTPETSSSATPTPAATSDSK